MDNLERKIKEIILPETAFEIDSTWSGIMVIKKLFNS